MSRFPPTNPNNVFSRPLHLPSPPETDQETLGGTVMPDPAFIQSAGVGSPVDRLKRGPSLGYKQSAYTKDSQRAAPKSSKWLVLVLPPTHVRQDPSLGPILASAPPGRFSSGILTPLFPTLYAQLASIAREYSIPSTSGLCVYLQMTDGGINFSPRLSEEAWQLLWSHHFTADQWDRQPALPSHQLPICGRIEFDIDVKRAKWYPSWIAGHIRHLSDEQTASVSEKRGSVYDGDDRDGTESELSNFKGLHLPLSSRRHVPRRLSLLDRRETDLPPIRGSIRTPSRLNHVEHDSGSSRLAVGGKHFIHSLSPVVQAEEPLTASQKDVNAFVRQWRESNTPTAPHNIPPSPAPEIQHTRPSISDLTALHSPQLDLADFAFSVSSRGPASPTSSAFSLNYTPSVDLAQRVRGSVCLSPSTQTSWGPASAGYENFPLSARSLIDRLPSPDVAARMIEDSPNTPSTATTWGPPSTYPSTPVSPYRLPTPDIGQRIVENAPRTPSTATSWGPPSSYPSSPNTEIEWVRTPDVGERLFSPSMQARWPTANSVPALIPAPAAIRSRMGWPYHTRSSVSTVDSSRQPTNPKPTLLASPITTILPSSYPVFNLYPAAYPVIEIYPPLGIPALSSCTTQLVSSESRPLSSASLPVRLPPVYPTFDIYGSAYPNLVVYPPITLPSSRKSPSAEMACSVSLPPCYPSFVLYPPVYPFLTIYPDVIIAPVKIENLKKKFDAPTSYYPMPEIYAPVYPYVTPYPSVRLPSVSLGPTLLSKPPSLSVSLPQPAALYPEFNLYPSQYPSIEIYPAKVKASFTEDSSSLFLLVSTALSTKYPIFNIYPAVYPHVIPYPQLLERLTFVPTLTDDPSEAFDSSYILHDLDDSVVQLLEEERAKVEAAIPLSLIPLEMRSSMSFPSSPRSRSSTIRLLSPINTSESDDQKRSREELHDLIFGGNPLPVGRDPPSNVLQSVPNSAHPDSEEWIPGRERSDSNPPISMDDLPIALRSNSLVDTEVQIASPRIRSIEVIEVPNSRDSSPVRTLRKPSSMHSTVPLHPTMGRRSSVSSRQPPVLSRVAHLAIPEEVTPEGEWSSPIQSRTGKFPPAPISTKHGRTTSTQVGVGKDERGLVEHQLDRSKSTGSMRVRSSTISIKDRQAMFSGAGGKPSGSGDEGPSPQQEPSNPLSRRPSVSRLDPSRLYNYI